MDCHASSGLEPLVGISMESLGVMIDSNSQLEAQVHRILTVNDNHGYAAFSQRNELLGFYRYEEGKATLRFFPKSMFAQTKKQERALEKKVKCGGKHVLSKDDVITLGALKEQATLALFQSSML
jgi:hypothetical protein